VWKANQSIGSRLIDQVGTVCWNELTTTNTLMAGNFYSRLFGWGRQIQQMDLLEYTILVNEDEPAAGMYQFTSAMDDALPQWLIYFAVEDCKLSVDRACKMGAQTLTPLKEIHEVGRYCVMKDPQGATFAVIRLFNL
jgi:predicted enzyme related to lactoylglutathione lyase